MVFRPDRRRFDDVKTIWTTIFEGDSFPNLFLQQRFADTCLSNRDKFRQTYACMTQGLR